MAEIDTTSIFGDLDRKDPESMRRVMSYIMVRLSGAAHIDASVISDLEPTEIPDANRIANEAKDAPFLKEILSIFATARYRSDRRVLQAANGIDLVAIEAIRMPNSCPTREYDLAVAFFQSLLEKGEMRYYAEGENEYGDIIDSDDESLDCSRKRPGDTLRDPTAYDDQLSLKAVVGEEEPGVLSIVFEIFRIDPEDKTKTLETEKKYIWPHADKMQWDNATMISQLNAWRARVFKRWGLSGKSAKNETWMESERDKLLELVQNHLASPDIGGRWLLIDWGMMERDMWNHFEGTMHPVGEWTAPIEYENLLRRTSRCSEHKALTAPRPASHRAARALMVAMLHFKDERAKQLVQDARAADDQYSQNQKAQKVHGKAAAKKAARVTDEEVDEETDDETDTETQSLDSDMGSGEPPAKKVRLN